MMLRRMWLYVAIVGLLAFLAVLAVLRLEGRAADKAISDEKEKDHAHADDLRRRVERELDRLLDEFEDRGFRD